MRTNPSLTAVLCGVRLDVTHDDIKKVLTKHKEGLLPLYLEGTGVSNIIKDKFDSAAGNERRLAFLNCKSKHAATMVCAALNRIPCKELGMEKYGWELQVVLKHDLRSVVWATKIVTLKKTVEGPIAKKRNIDCLIDSPMRCHNKVQ